MDIISSNETSIQKLMSGLSTTAKVLGVVLELKYMAPADSTLKNTED
jgi:hypothetical protein